MVDDEFRVRSNDRGDQLRMWVVKPGDEWRAKLECADLTAEAKVHERYSRDALALDAYFADLAEHRRGWSGEKEWEALGLRLAARHDGLGHVTLDASLETNHTTADRWRVRASLTLDAGTLDRLASEARRLDQR